VEPENQNSEAIDALQGVGRKNPTIHVLDSLMGMGKSTALINMIKEDAMASVIFQEAGVPSKRWLVIVPTLSEVDRYVDALSTFGAPFEMPNDTFHNRKHLHLLQMVKDGQNIVATHALFNQLSRQVYEAIEALDYTLVIDEEIEVVRPYELHAKKVATLIEKEFVLHDPVSRRLTWNSRKWSTDRFPFKSDIPKLCEAGHLVMSKAGLLIVETPAEFLRCFDEVWIATYMFSGAPMRAYLEDHRFPINMLTVAKDHRGNRQVIPWRATDDERGIRAELRKLIKVYNGRRNMVGTNSHKASPLTSTWYNAKAKNDPQAIVNLATSIARFFKETAPADKVAWTTFKRGDNDGPYDGPMRVEGLMVDCKKDGEAYGFLAYNTRATNAYRNVEAMAYPLNVFQHGDVRGYFDERGIATSEDLYAISTLVQWLWRSRIRQEPRQSVTVYLPSERMRGLFLEWLWADSTEAFVKEKMDGARRAFEVSRKGWVKPRSAEVGFEAKIVARISPPVAIAA
jgi:hypothetical protein